MSSDLKIAVIFEFFNLDGYFASVNDRLISCANETLSEYLADFNIFVGTE